MSKNQDILAKLSKSLDNANKRDAKRKKPAAAPKAPAGDRKCTKISVSLFQTDMDRIDAIRDYMHGHGRRISTSQAVKLALRTAPLSDDLQRALDAASDEDGRKL